MRLRKKIFVPMMIAIIVALCWPVNVSACVLFYAGGDTTDDGANLFVRTEEVDADANKTYYVAPAGNHKAGETYQGCTDFTWTFTHDSYKYTARCDGLIDGVCLNCESDHPHTPYEEAGTNDHGVTVSATQSLNANEKIQEVDPFTDEGIEESEMATVLLSEASSAREGVALLTSIYDSVGAGYEGAGVMICDQNEQWYVENLSGHEYIAVLLPSDVCFMQFNVSVLGKIDLDDTDHVIASEHLFDVAKEAGTFVGDEEENIINYRASFNDYLMEIENEDWPAEWRVHVQERLVAALNYMEDTEEWTTDNVLEGNHFVMTNVGEDGAITGLHNDLALAKDMSFDNVLALFRISPIAYEENVNTHMYRFYPEEEQTLGTVEWFAMDNTAYSVYVPSYPMLLTDTWEGYKVQLGEPEVTEQKPDGGDWYYHDGEYHVHPVGWEKSYIATLSAMTNLLTYGDLDGEQLGQAQERLLNLQGEFETRFAALQEEIKAEPSFEAREGIMTSADMEMAEEVHDLALSIYRENTPAAESNSTGEAEANLTPDGEKGFPVAPLIVIILLLAAAIAGVMYYRKRSK